MEEDDEFQDLKKGNITQANELINRIIAIYRVLFGGDFILVNYKLVNTPEGRMIHTRSIFRTDFNGEVDRSALRLSIEVSESLNKEK